MSDSAMVYYVRFKGHNSGIIGKRPTDSSHQPGEGENVVSKKVRKSSAKTNAPGQTMSDTYSFTEVSKLFDITKSRLKYWDKSGFLSPSGHKGRSRCYTFQDLLGIRSVKTLLDKGISLQRTRHILKKINEAIPRSSHPLGHLRIMADDKTVIVTDSSHDFDADTGQLLLDFEVKNFEEEIVRDMPNKEADNIDSMSAYEWYLQGCSLDETPETMAEAEKAYHHAIYLDPTLANAYTNLGNLLYRNGSMQDAKALYEKAIEVDLNQPEAHYNLGFLEFEGKNFKEAKTCFVKAIELDSTFADAHFNLAITLFRLGQSKLARQKLKTYLNLEPSGPWADMARKRLSENTSK